MRKIKVNLDDIIKQFEKCTTNPTIFLSIQAGLEDDLKSQLKSLYDFTKMSEGISNKDNSTVPKLIVNEFDTEQLWQQVELQNQFILKDLVEKLSVYTEDDAFKAENEQNNDEDDESSRDEHFDENSENDELELGSDDEDALTDDINEESELEGKEDDDVNDDKCMKNDVTEDYEKNEKDYENNFTDNLDDFLNKKLQGAEKEKKIVKFNLEEPNVENKQTLAKDDDELKSTFEERQGRLQKHIEKLEEEAVAEKPWQLKGEATAKTRPQNSLLEEILEFDLTSRPAPIITEEAAIKLEDVILRRIKDQAWDDVEKKIKPVDTPFEFKKKLVLDQEKSKLSLAKIYEQEYLKQKDAIDPENKFKKEEEPKEHTQIRNLLDHLFQKLDSLSNYHYVPLPVVPEVKIVNNLPAISMEEAIPAAVSNAALLAPEEIQEGKQGELMSKEERTDTDKKRSRRKKKLKQKLKSKEIKARSIYLEKVKFSKSNKHGREKLKQELEKLSKNSNVSHLQVDVNNAKASKSSKQFFNQLQDTLASGSKLKRKKETVKHDAKKIKL